ncbi:glutamate--tRNA ligase [Candidatus Legionella polyplacis]|uniref:Glutamate--tRNA ligase n=1 Tax=Candidatus Legionella polyplacis TaxID=2005262 RepID=A0ABZ2GZX8_9GAMM
MFVITRFAPSPTGFLHIGSIRTALFSWLYARRFNGKFLLRIDDTDISRIKIDYIHSILSSMSWLGLNYDNNPFYQSHNYFRYQEIISKLLDEKKAYYCRCTQKRLNILRINQINNNKKPKYDRYCRDKNFSFKKDIYQVIRFKTPISGIVSFCDKVYGNINVKNNELDDFVLIRSNGAPTYNFSSVVDDFDMKVTHIIRGNDHISNTPKQINLFNALNVKLPVFAHLPMILGNDGKSLSKRSGSVDIIKFKKLGILPQALLNCLVRLGWSYGNKEIFSMEDMIHYFDLTNINHSNARFSYDKLYWLNKYYQKNMSEEEINSILFEYFRALNINLNNGPRLVDLFNVQSGRYNTLVEICENSRTFYQNKVIYDMSLVGKYFKLCFLPFFIKLQKELTLLDDWNENKILEFVKKLSIKNNITVNNVIQILRVILTGNDCSFSIKKIFIFLGKKRVLLRLKESLKLFN